MSKNASKTKTAAILMMSDSSEKVDQGTPAQYIFFQKLHNMINNDPTGCVCWTPDGKGFAICSKEGFCDNILPRYFGQAKFTSFTRRLKRWGFKREGGSYHNKSFYRDMVFEDVDFEAEYPAVMGSVAAPSNTQVCRGPPKKRKHWTSPSPSPFEQFEDHCPSQHGSPSAKNSDVEVMPELMRTINRLKRKEKGGKGQEAVPLPTKETTTHLNGAIERSNTLMQSVEAAQTLASLVQHGHPQRDYLDRLAARNRAQQEHLNRLAASSCLMEDFRLSDSPYTSYTSRGREMVTPQNEVHQTEYSSLPSLWPGDTHDLYSLLHPSKNEDQYSLHGLCQFTSDSSRVPIQNPQQRKTPAFNRAA